MSQDVVYVILKRKVNGRARYPVCYQESQLAASTYIDLLADDPSYKGWTFSIRPLFKGVIVIDLEGKETK